MFFMKKSIATIQRGWAEGGDPHSKSMERTHQPRVRGQLRMPDIGGTYVCAREAIPLLKTRVVSSDLPF